MLSPFAKLLRGAGCTKAELARRTSLDPRTIANLEREPHRCDGLTLCLVADALGCTPNDLLGFGGARDLATAWREFVQVVHATTRWGVPFSFLNVYRHARDTESHPIFAGQLAALVRLAEAADTVGPQIEALLESGILNRRQAMILSDACDAGECAKGLALILEQDARRSTLPVNDRASA